jgi:hypothetical protein
MKIRRALLFAALPFFALVAPPTTNVQAEPAACASWVVEYVLSPGSQLKIEGTPFGAGNGTFNIGPGRLKLRLSSRHGKPALKGKVEVVSYTMRAHVPVTTKVLGMRTTVTSDTATHVEKDRCGRVAKGLFKGTQLLWTTPFRRYRTDGTITCRGPLCGRFGAPPEGRSEVHIPPRPVRLMPLTFKAGDPKHFTSTFYLMDKTKSPPSKNYMRLVGHEVARSCEKTKHVCGR